MSVFPVIDSVLSPAHLAVWVSEEYGLHEVTVQLLKTNMNHSYAVDALEGKFVLRIYSQRFRSRMQVMEELRVIGAARAGGVAVSSPVAAKTRALMSGIPAPEGMRFAVLFSFAPGEKVRVLSAAMCEAVGRTTAQLHASTAGMHLQRQEYTAASLVGWARAQVAGRFPAMVAELDTFDRIETETAKAFQAHPLRTGVVHLDIWYDNFSIRPDGLPVLYDFDNTGNGPLILDIGYFCMQLFFVEQEETAYMEKKRAFLSGYRSLLPLPEEELAALPYAGAAIWLHYLGVQCERFARSPISSPNYIRMYLSRLDPWLGRR